MQCLRILMRLAMAVVVVTLPLSQACGPVSGNVPVEVVVYVMQCFTQSSLMARYLNAQMIPEPLPPFRIGRVEFRQQGQ